MVHYPVIVFKFYFLSFISIVIISFLVLYPSFNLAFEDEDWRGVVLPKTDYANIKLSTYSSPVWFMDTIYTWLGPNFLPYYILAFIFRTLLVFSILVFIYTVIKDRLASFLGALFLAVTFTGIQTTYEVMNMISYLSMIGLIIFLTFFFKLFEKLSFINLITMGTSLLIATYIASFRVYPVYAWAFIVDSSRLLIRFKKEMIKPFLIRQLVILIVFLFLYKIGIFSWYSINAPPEKGINDISRFISDTTIFFTSLNSNIIANFVKGLGNIIFPSILDKSGMISIFLGVVLIISLIGVFIYRISSRTKNIHSLLSFLLWPLLFFTSYFIIYTIGGHRGSPPLPSSMRYLLPPFIGFTIALAILISLTRKIKSSRIILGSVVILILIHAISTYSFLSKLSEYRDGRFMTKIWEQIYQLVPESSLSTEKMNVFYFDIGTAKINDRTFYTVSDGFIPHVLAVYKIDTKPVKFETAEMIAFNSRIAPPVMTYEELVSYIKKSLSENPEPDIWNRIFTLRVVGDRVVDVKEDIKKRIEISLKSGNI